MAEFGEPKIVASTKAFEAAMHKANEALRKMIRELGNDDQKQAASLRPGDIIHYATGSRCLEYVYLSQGQIMKMTEQPTIAVPIEDMPYWHLSSDCAF